MAGVVGCSTHAASGASTDFPEGDSFLHSRGDAGSSWGWVGDGVSGSSTAGAGGSSTMV